MRLLFLGYLLASQGMLANLRFRRNYNEGAAKRGDGSSFYGPKVICVGALAGAVVIAVQQNGYTPWLHFYVIASLLVIASETLRATRKFWKIPVRNNPFCEYYSVAYDTVTDGQVRSEFTMVLSLLLGWFHPLVFYPFVMLDVVTISPKLKNVVKAITTPFADLIATFALFVIVLFIFSAIGFLYFGDFLRDGDPVEYGGSDVLLANTLLHCFLTFFSEGWRSGDIGGFMTTSNFGMCYRASVMRVAL
jgi:hypothetical protein